MRSQAEYGSEGKGLQACFYYFRVIRCCFLFRDGSSLILLGDYCIFYSFDLSFGPYLETLGPDKRRGLFRFTRSRPRSYANPQVVTVYTDC